MEELELLFAIQPDPPTEIRLFGFGETETSKGKFVLDRSAAQMLMDKYREQGTDRLAFDYGHGMVIHTRRPGGLSPRFERMAFMRPTSNGRIPP